MRRTIPPPTIEATGRVLTLEQARLYLRYSKSHMYKLTSNGVLPFSKPIPGGRIYFDRQKLDEWLLGNYSMSDHERDSAAATHVSTNPL